jgi:hypothetical protein
MTSDLLYVRNRLNYLSLFDGIDPLFVVLIKIYFVLFCLFLFVVINWVAGYFVPATSPSFFFYYLFNALVLY